MTKVSDKWSEYSLLDTSDGTRLEKWGETVLIRPDPQIMWNGVKKSSMWNKADAIYHRSGKGGGHWSQNVALPSDWNIEYKPLNLVFKVKPTGFKHTGIFPEQAVNWEYIFDKISAQKNKVKMLNMFAYTGGATLAAAKAGAEVCHVDASRGMVNWAKENASLSGLSDAPIRYIVDDCVKFAEREVRRGKKYDCIIMDPPTYGRGPDGEMWRLSDNISSLLDICLKLLSDNPLFLILNSYTTGFSAEAASYLLNIKIKNKLGGKVSSDEIGLPVKETGLILPCGVTTVWENE